MFDHVGLESTNAAASIAFYEHVLPTLGLYKAFAYEGGAAYGDVEGQVFGIGSTAGFSNLQEPLFFIDQVKTNQVTANVHIAFRAKSRAQVEAFYQAAIAAGGKEHFAPDLIPEYHPNYYAAFVFDLDGNKIEAVCHSPA